MNPHASPSMSLAGLVGSIWSNRQLIAQMAKREVIGRYRGSILGLAWSFLNPLLMLSVYTFVFSVVFKARWGSGPADAEESKALFAVMLFVGLIVHGIFAEVINKAPALILGNSNYVTKVIFPIEILPVISMGAAFFHSLISILVLLIAYSIFISPPPWTVVLVPIVFAPLIVLTLGLAWILASVGTFLRDVGQTVGIITTIMLFLSPVFFPMEALPEKYHGLMTLNPLTFIIEQARLVLVLGETPDMAGLGLYALLAVAIAWCGFAWFQATRKGFADVL